MSQPARNGTNFRKHTPPDNQYSRSAMTSKPKLVHYRSSTFDETTPAMENLSPEAKEQFTQSDAAQVRNWQSSRTKAVPQSVPTYKFSLHGAPGAESRPRRVPGQFVRTETVASGIGGSCQDQENSTAPECGVCMENFSDDAGLRVPRLLSCGHSYCTECLEKLLLQSPASTPSITCPQCNKTTLPTDRDVTNLPKNFSLLVVIRESLKVNSSCPPPSSFPQPSNPQRERERSPAVMRCEEHNGDNLSSFCTKCDVLVCSSCLLYGKHRGHNNKTMFVNEAAAMYRQKLLEMSPEVKNQRQKMEDALLKVEKMNASVQEMGGRLVQEAENTYDELIRLIEARRDALKLEIMERTQLRVEALTDQASDLKECIEKAAAVQHTTELLLRSDEYTLLQRAVLTMDEIEGVFVNPPPSIPRAQNDLKCEFPSGPKDEIASNLTGYGSVRPDVGIISNIYVKPYHDGFRIQWDGHNFTDNEGTTYYLQKAVGEDGEFTALYRGSSTKYTYKEDLEHGVPYRFRVQVRTTVGVGNWSKPKEAVKAVPDFRWHETWRSVKIELSHDKLEAKGGSHNFWATVAGDKLMLRGKPHYVEIEILDPGKSKSHKKLAFGVVSCRKSRASSLPWHDGKHPIGQWEIPSWSFQPVSGVIHSQDTPLEGFKYSSESTLQTGDRLGMLVDLDEGKITYFVNGAELGVAFDSIDEESVLPSVSLRDKIRVLLRFPPPPYVKRNVKFIKLSSQGTMDM